jgi:hypothetical protein
MREVARGPAAGSLASGSGYGSGPRSAPGLARERSAAAPGLASEVAP